jgi:hypothetical protein
MQVPPVLYTLYDTRRQQRYGDREVGTGRSRHVGTKSGGREGEERNTMHTMHTLLVLE